MIHQENRIEAWSSSDSLLNYGYYHLAILLLWPRSQNDGLPNPQPRNPSLLSSLFVILPTLCPLLHHFSFFPFLPAQWGVPIHCGFFWLLQHDLCWISINMSSWDLTFDIQRKDFSIQSRESLSSKGEYNIVTNKFRTWAMCGGAHLKSQISGGRK